MIVLKNLNNNIKVECLNKLAIQFNSPHHWTCCEGSHTANSLRILLSLPFRNWSHEWQSDSGPKRMTVGYGDVVQVLWRFVGLHQTCKGTLDESGPCHTPAMNIENRCFGWTHWSNILHIICGEVGNKLRYEINDLRCKQRLVSGSRLWCTLKTKQNTT